MSDKLQHSKTNMTRLQRWDPKNGSQPIMCPSAHALAEMLLFVQNQRQKKDKTFSLIKARVAEQSSLPSSADWGWMGFDTSRTQILMSFF